MFLRVGIGLMFACCFGWMKISGGPAFWAKLGASISVLHVPVFWPALWGFFSACAEFFGALCFALGLFFRPAVFLLVCNMTVATLTLLHAGGSFAMTTSRPLELLIVFIAMLFVGPGRYSLDALL